MPPQKSIGVVGLGYVGLITAVGFALKGYPVIGVDQDGERGRIFAGADLLFTRRA